MLFLSLLSAILLHESGHLFALMLFRARIVTFRLSFFGITLCHTPLPSPFASFLVAGFGPLFSILGYIVSQYSVELHTFSLISLMLGLFNLLPIATLDGEKICKTLLSLLLSPTRAELCATLISYTVLFCLWLIGGYLVLWLDASPSLFLLSVTLFLQNVRQNNKRNAKQKN